ncbi:hypothetical protein GCM10011514_52960 [Emticicia aquatilis]|uniref:Uncharacterized protein n=1 Tax=Emticicia aquatilis TaxID=1537369 RepID=A0A916Z9T0_9BACT|nr:hypothetical protein [Emticicia aquatilis]GGD82325.1 hypothetical protein GCM10011514_52960 [Emticicia aquatilis]
MLVVGSLKAILFKMANSKQISYENRVTAFIDILGFKQLIKESTSNIEKIELLYKVLKFLKSFERPSKWSTEIVSIEENAQSKGIDNFKIEGSVQCTTFSDSIVISILVNDTNINEVTSTLITNLSEVGSILVQANILWRGAISVGQLIHEKNGIVLGQALIDAYTFENSYAKYPRIILTDKLIKQLNYPYKSKPESYPYHLYVERFEDGLVGFHQLKYFEVVQDALFGNTNILKNSINRAKNTIINGLDSSFDSPDVFLKYKWLKEIYNNLYIDSKIKPKIHELNESIRGNNIHFSYTQDFYSKND